MMRRQSREAAVGLCLAALGACASPQAPATSSTSWSGIVPPQDVRLPSGDEGGVNSFFPARGNPAVAAATADLEVTPPEERSVVLMVRARAAFSAARQSRAEQRGPFGVVPLTTHERFLSYCELALRDIDEVLTAVPGSPEAPEAIYTKGQINDYPNLNLFDEALQAYRLTAERYPDTPWARRARERIVLIEEITNSRTGSAPSAPVTGPDPFR